MSEKKDQVDLFPSDSDSDSGSSGSSSSSSSSGSNSDSGSESGSASSASARQTQKKKGGPSRKDDYPIPKRLRRFLDIEAGEGDEEEEEEDLDEEGMAERRAVRQRELDRLRREVATRKKAGTHRLKTVIDEIEERAKRMDETANAEDRLAESAPLPYGDERLGGAYSDIEGDEGVVSRMPTLEDDKLFMVKVNESGKERQIIAQLITKAALTREAHCKSFFTTDGLRGYIYIEAPGEAAVRQFLLGIRSVQAYSAKIVPFNEQLAVFKSAVKAAADRLTPVEADAWVRVKRNALYGGDLGKVHRDLGEDGIEVLLVPRIDVEAVKRGRATQTRSVLPAAVFFDRIYREVAEHVDRVKDKELGMYVYQLNGERFTEQGYLIKRFARKALETVAANVAAQTSEMRAFSREATATDSRVATPQTAAKFFLGEQVTVVEGDLRGVSGRVVNIYGERSQVTIRSDKVSNQELEFGFAQVRKVWTAGEHVVLTAKDGADEGETGMVVRQTDRMLAGEGFRVTVLLDGDQREVSVDSNDLRVASEEKAIGETSVDGISIGDMVVMRQTLTGVVVRLAKSGNLTLLSTGGERISGHVHEITNRKPNQRGAFAVSKHGDSFGLGSSVRVLAPGVGLVEGTVQYMVGNATVFVKVRGQVAETGFIVANPKDVEVLVAQERRQTPGNQSGGADSMAANRPPPRPTMVSSAVSGMTGAKVRIIKGTYKGYTGTIRDMQDTKVQVSLDAKFKVITLPKDQVRAIDANEAAIAVGSVTSAALTAPPLPGTTSYYTPMAGSVGSQSLYRPPSALPVAVAEPKTPACVFEDADEPQEVAEWWLTRGTVVEVEGARGVVIRVELSEGRVRVKMADEGNIRSVGFAQCKRVQPTQGDFVKVGAGPLQGVEGELIGFQEDRDAVIMTADTQDLKVVDIRDVLVFTAA